MTQPTQSYRQILRSSSIMALAALINVIIGLARVKIIAMLLGPSGVGLVGLLQNIVTTASTLAGLGLNESGTRAVAAAVGCEDSSVIVAVRRALFYGTAILGVTGGVTFFLLSEVIAAELFNKPDTRYQIGWLAFAVVLTVASGSQMALLSGMRQIGDIALTTIFSSLISSLLGLVAILVLREKGILVMITLAPLSVFLLAHLFVARLPKPHSCKVPFSKIIGQWRMLVGLGAALVVSGLALAIAQLVVRLLIKNNLGTESLGHFQSAWMISMTYIGFILAAMGTDYYPRLTAVIDDQIAVNNLVNQQTEISLLLAGPAMIAIVSFAPWIIELLYTDEFLVASPLLRWHIFGDILKLASWPLGFIFLAAGDGRTYMFTEVLGLTVFVAITWFALPFMGIQSTGIAFLCMYLVYFPMVYRLAKRKTGFTWNASVIKLMLSLVTATSALCLLAMIGDLVALLSGSLATLVFATVSAVRISKMAEISGKLYKLSIMLQSLIGKFGFKYG